MSKRTFTRRNWPSRQSHRSPLCDLDLGGHLPENRAFPRWADHQYVGRDDEGRTVYACCPYQLYGEAVRDLAYLESRGWHVFVHAHAVYGNGTVQIELYREIEP